MYEKASPKPGFMGFFDIKKAAKRIDRSIRDHHSDSKQKFETGQSNPILDQSDQWPGENGAQNTFEKPAEHNGDIFAEPISIEEPPRIFKRVAHEQVPKGCAHGDGDEPIQTNNFYNNLTLEDQTFPIWPLPYSLWFTRDPNSITGFALNHTDASQRVFGPDSSASPAQFYFNPPRIQSIVFSGHSVRHDNTHLLLTDHEKMSVTAKLVPEGSSNKSITFPLVQGMGFVTAIYNNIVPIIGSQVGFKDFKFQKSINGLKKYRVTLFNEVTWSLYVKGNVDLKLSGQNIIEGSGLCSDLIVQCCKGDSKFYDECCGIYPIKCDVSAEIESNDRRACLYSFSYSMIGTSKSGRGIVWCLPHHQEALTASSKKNATDLKLDSPTKGVMQAYIANSLTMKEFDLPVYVNWEPWSSVERFSGKANYSNKALEIIKKATELEVQQDVVAMANIDSMYTSGKILDKFAYIAYCAHFILHDASLTSIILPKIKQAIEIFARNQQAFPLVYDKTWKGLISSAEPAADFGNSCYNDHHFHYGYHIHAIALVAKVDSDNGTGSWLHDNNNLVYNYAQTLLRDVCNSSKKDRFFPQFRCFDWYHGHSFAHGIFASGDGKDEESSSEDYHFAYGMKLFANVTGHLDMENRANLMLAVMKRSMNMYMLFSDDNRIQPKRIIGNKVAGITFENKIDYATYFGRGQIGDEWVHGIHMLPITPISSYIRQKSFVKEEWDQKLGPIVNRITDGWKGILMLNYALFDPVESWRWFARSDWHDSLIDNGMSRTWSLAYTAGIGGAE